MSGAPYARVPGGGAIVLRGGSVVSCVRPGEVLKGDVLIEDGTITAVGKVRAPRGSTVVDVRDRIVAPGMVMAHVHLCQVLMRGMADDLPLLEWLRKRIWPLEAAHDERSLRASAELGLVELLSSGVTAILDLGTVHDYDVVLDACVRSGIRVVGGKSLMDKGRGVPKRMRESTRAALKDAERLDAEWAGHASGRVDVAWIPRFILSCSERLVRGAVERAEQLGALLHTHAAEHPGEKAAVRAELGADDTEVLAKWGVVGPRTSFAHCVQVTESGARRLAKRKTGVVHCPSANLKLGSGMAPIAELDAAGVLLGIGADGAPCNNNLDPFLEMRHAALIAAVRSGPGTVPAARVLRMATSDGAELLGAGDARGTLEVGKRADIIVVRADGPHAAPSPDPVSTLVYAARGSDVQHVFIDGNQVVRDGQVLTLDAARITATAPAEARRLAGRAGL